MLRRLSLLLLWCVMGATLYAQTPAVNIPLTVTDGATGNATLRFGLDPTATDGIDAALGEQPLPPMPPTGVFDTRFNLPASTESSLKDYRTGTANFVGQKIHEIQYQVGTGTTIQIGWTLPTGVTGRLQDLILGTIIDVNMAGTGNYTVTNPGAINKLKMTVTYDLGSVILPPAAPTLATPANNATNQPTALTLTWNASANAQTYRVQVSTSNAFTTTIVNDSTVTGTSKQISGLANSTVYYWRVNAKNTAGTSVYSSVFQFTTTAGVVVPPVPVLTTPANNATNQPTALTLNWEPSTGATSYRVQVSTSNAFTTTIVNDSTVTGTSKQISGLSTSTTYYWRVNAKNTAGTSNYSNVFSFTTQGGGTGLVFDVPLTVTDGTKGNSTLKFGIAPDATDGIDAQYGEQPLPPVPPTGVFDARFNLPVNNESSLKDYRQGASGFSGQKIHEIQYQVGTGTTITLGWVLPSGVTGRLQDIVTGTIIDVNMTGTGNYTVTNPGAINKLKMTITYSSAPQPPAAPTLLTPANGATNQPTSVNLTWNASAGAATYRVQVSTSNAFTTTIVNDSTVTGTSKQVTGLSTNTMYYWRVNAKNANGTSAYSSVFNFTTQGGGTGLVYDLPITVTDNAGGNGTLRFGLAPDATDGIDAQYGEQPLPPVPPTGVFDSRFNLPVNNEASLKDYRQGASGFTGQKIHEIQYQVGTGTTVTLGWALPSGVTGRLQDIVTGTIIDVNMTGTGNYTVTNPGAINKLKMTITYSSAPQPPAAPTLVSPANNATNQPTSLNLTWEPSTGAATYRVQVSTSSAFTTTIVNDSTVTGTSKQVTGLSTNTMYYWRVNAKNAAGTSAYSTVFNFTTQGGGTGLVYDLPITLNDNAGGSNTLRFGLAPDATDGLDPQYGEAPLPPIPPTGVYDGRFNLPVNNESSIKDYRQGATGFVGTKIHEIQYQVGTGTTITVGWALPSGVVGRLQDIVTGTIIDVPMNGTGNYTVTNPGAINKLKMTVTYGTPVVPAVPTLLLPANNALNVAVNPTVFKWSKPAGADSYRLQVATNAAFTTIVYNDSTITDSTKSVTGLNYSTTYYWRVNAKSSAGTSAFSSAFSFATAAPPPPPAAPVLVTPPNNAVNQATSLILGWNASTGATSYRVQLAKDQAFTNIVVNDSTVTGTTKAVGPLDNNTMYFWRVNAKNANGTSAYSTIFNFKTVVSTSIAVDAPLTVTDNSGGLLQLRFGIAPGATDGLDTLFGEYPLPPLPPTGVFDARFNLPVGNESSLKDYRQGDTTFVGQKIYELQYQVGAGSTITINWLLPSRMLGRLQDIVTGSLIDVPMIGTGSLTVPNPGAISKLKMTIQYLLPSPPPVAPTLLEPANNSTGIPVSPTLKWSKPQYALNYILQISKSSLFSSFAYIDSTLIDTVKKVPALEGMTKYFWRVKARNTAGASSFSTVFNFTTSEAGVATAPTLVSPENNTRKQPLALTLNWTKVPAATGYHVQLGMDTLTFMVNDTAVVDTFRAVTGLKETGNYYWRARGKNSVGYGPFSGWFKFTTLLSAPDSMKAVAQGRLLKVVLTWNDRSNAETAYILERKFGTAAYNVLATLGPNIVTYTDSTVSNGRTYTYRIKAVNSVDTSLYSNESLPTPVSVRKENLTATQFDLAQNYPNPFNPATRIEYSVPVEAKVVLEVYSALGEKVATLVNATQTAGVYEAIFNASNLNSGMYLVRIEARANNQSFVQIRKMVLMK